MYSLTLFFFCKGKGQIKLSFIDIYKLVNCFDISDCSPSVSLKGMKDVMTAYLSAYP